MAPRAIARLKGGWQLDGLVSHLPSHWRRRPALRTRHGLCSSGQGISVDFIGSDKLDAPELHRSPLIAFLNLRGDQNEDAPLLRKVVRILTYYARLASYVPRSQAQIFHLLWNNKFEHFDRTALMLYYRLFGKRVVFTAHNVNARKRDGCDSWLNRFTLRISTGSAPIFWSIRQR